MHVHTQIHVTRFPRSSVHPQAWREALVGMTIPLITDEEYCSLKPQPKQARGPEWFFIRMPILVACLKKAGRNEAARYWASIHKQCLLLPATCAEPVIEEAA